MTNHGGDVWQVAEEWGVPASGLLDFSANINPRGLPERALERLAHDGADALLLRRYPDPSARRLRLALSGKLGVDPDAIVIGPGAESLFSPTLQSLQARRALIPIPAFGEYRRVCTQHDVQTEVFPLCAREGFRIPVDRFSAAIRHGRFEVVFVNNPHNPSGSALPAMDVNAILDVARESSATLALDEAFIDYCPNQSLTCEAASRGGVVVYRSLTKIYGCPALRIGYAVAEPSTARRIREFLAAWPVTQLAVDALTEAIGDSEYVANSLRENCERRQELTTAFQQMGVGVTPSVANFLFLELPESSVPAAELRTRLIRNHGILIRNCDSYEGLPPGRYVRVAVRASAENFRLVEAMRQELR